MAGKAHVATETSAKLIDRESEVLRLVAVGHSNIEIAARLDISVKTVEVHKTNAMWMPHRPTNPLSGVQRVAIVNLTFNPNDRAL